MMTVATTIDRQIDHARSTRFASSVTGSPSIDKVAGKVRPMIALRSSDDIACIRRAGSVAAQALAAARVACIAGASTSSIDAAARNTIESAGGEPLFLGYRGSEGSAKDAFPATTCISINDELVHGVPSARVIVDGDLVSIDVGVRLDGWCADCAITVAVGAVSAPSRRMLECTERMLACAIESIVPGRRWSEVARAVEAIAVAEGFTIAADFVGHGIGRALHEAPQVPCTVYRSYLECGDFTLRPGMVLAIEPMLVLEPVRHNALGELAGPRVALAADGWTVMVASGAPSCHVEHTIAVNRDGAEVLTRFVPSNTYTTTKQSPSLCNVS
jgi:methionyl aminopeptidase